MHIHTLNITQDNKAIVISYINVLCEKTKQHYTFLNYKHVLFLKQIIWISISIKYLFNKHIQYIKHKNILNLN